MSMLQLLFASFSDPMIVVDGADFDGTNDHMTHVGTLSGAADSKSWIVSAWFRIDGGDGVQQTLYHGDANSRFFLQRNSNNLFQLSGKNAANSVIFNLTTVNTYLASATWLHFLSSGNLAVPGARSIYINDVSDLAEISFVDDTIDYTAGTGAVSFPV